MQRGDVEIELTNALKKRGTTMAQTDLIGRIEDAYEQGKRDCNKELLEALERIAKCNINGSAVYDGADYMKRTAETALAKARGES